MSQFESVQLPVNVGEGPLKNEPNSCCSSDAKGALSSTKTNESPEDEYRGDEGDSLLFLFGIMIGFDFCVDESDGSSLPFLDKSSDSLCKRLLKGASGIRGSNESEIIE